MLAAILLVFTVLLIEFRSFNEPVAIVFGSVLALFGTVAALWITGITLNIVSFLGAIIGVGIVAKNGILMLDFSRQLQDNGVELVEALVRAGHRRLRPGADDLAGRRAGHVAAGLWHRRGRGHASAAGHCRHRRAVHLRVAVAGGDAGGLLHPALIQKSLAIRLMRTIAGPTVRPNKIYRAPVSGLMSGAAAEGWLSG